MEEAVEGLIEGDETTLDEEQQEAAVEHAEEQAKKAQQYLDTSLATLKDAFSGADAVKDLVKELEERGVPCTTLFTEEEFRTLSVQVP